MLFRSAQAEREAAAARCEALEVLGGERARRVRQHLRGLPGVTGVLGEAVDVPERLGAAVAAVLDRTASALLVDTAARLEALAAAASAEDAPIDLLAPDAVTGGGWLDAATRAAEAVGGDVLISLLRPRPPATAALLAALAGDVGGSEERRVGKECRALCRSRWSPYH